MHSSFTDFPVLHDYVYIFVDLAEHGVAPPPPPSVRCGAMEMTVVVVFQVMVVRAVWHAVRCGGDRAHAGGGCPPQVHGLRPAGPQVSQVQNGEASLPVCSGHVCLPVACLPSHLPDFPVAGHCGCVMFGSTLQSICNYQRFPSLAGSGLEDSFACVVCSWGF